MDEPITITLDAPGLKHSCAPPMVRVSDEKWNREREAFYRTLPGLLKTYRGKFVAVHGEQVVGEGDDSVTVAKQAYARLGYIPIYIGLVAEQPPRPVRIPSTRVARNQRDHRRPVP